MKKICIVVFSLCIMLALCVPAIAEEASASSESKSEGTSIDVDTGELAGQIEGSGDTLLDAMDESKSKVTNTIDGMAGVFQFFGYSIGGAIGVLPAGYGIYLLLMALAMTAVAVVKIINK